MNYRWSLGTLIGLPLLILTILILAGLSVFMFVGWKKEKAKSASYSEPGLVLAFFIACVVTTLIAIGGTLWGMWPYSAEYHQWQETSGVVLKIDSRLLAAGEGGTTERFVVTFTDDRQRSCDDTRCAQVEKGDELTLFCKRAWQWTGSHGYDCNYGSHKKQ